MIQFTRALPLAALLGLVLTSAAAPASSLASTANARQSSSVSGNCCSRSQVARATRTTNLGPSHPGTHSPWSIKRVLPVQGVAHLCSHHAAARFTASVRGYLAGVPLQGPGGGWVGRLFTKPNPYAFHAGDTRPFVQVWETKAWSLNLSNQQVTFHGSSRAMPRTTWTLAFLAGRV